MQQKYLDTGKLPCALTLVERNGEVAHLSALGHMDVERNRPLQEDTIFRIYSMTKPLTSVALMMLVEEGRIARRSRASLHPAVARSGRLRRRLHRLVPHAAHERADARGRPDAPHVGADLRLPAAHQRRCRLSQAHLGDCRRGVARAHGRRAGEGAARVLAGTAWNYSVSTDVVGYLVGKISGQPFEQFLRTRILDPLGMIDTGFHGAGRERLALRRVLRSDAGRPHDAAGRSADQRFLKPPGFVSGGGGLVSTAADYLRFCRMLLNGGALDGVRLISPKTLELMSMNHLPGGKELPDLSVSLFSEATYAGVGFGLGLPSHEPGALDDSGLGRRSLVGRPGSTYFWVDPREQSHRHLHDARYAVRPIRSAASCARWCTPRSPERLSEANAFGIERLAVDHARLRCFVDGFLAPRGVVRGEERTVNSTST